MKRLLCGGAAALLLGSCGSAHQVDPALQAAATPLATAGSPTVDPLLETSKTITGEALQYPSSPLPWLLSQVVTIGPGQSTGWHRHGVPTYGHLLSGTVEVEYAGEGRRTLKAGDTLLESMRVAHNAVNLGTEPVRILVVFMGAQGRQPVMKVGPPPMPAGLGGSLRSQLVDLARVDPSIRIDLRYAARNNFTGEPIYHSARALMQKPAAEALARVNRRALESGRVLLVLDAYRPWSVTRMFWDRYPMYRAWFADPLAGSRHNRGCAVDLTLADARTGAELEMPSDYDDFSERAHPGYKGGTAEQRANRELLRRLMESEGFTIYENEWWHFDYNGWQEWPVLDVDFDSVAGDAQHGAGSSPKTAKKTS